MAMLLQVLWPVLMLDCKWKLTKSKNINLTITHIFCIYTTELRAPNEYPFNMSLVTVFLPRSESVPACACVRACSLRWLNGCPQLGRALFRPRYASQWLQGHCRMSQALSTLERAFSLFTGSGFEFLKAKACMCVEMCVYGWRRNRKKYFANHLSESSHMKDGLSICKR